MALGEVGRKAAAALGIDADTAELVRDPRGPNPWESRLPVAALAADSVGLASLAVNLAMAARTGGLPAPVQVERLRVAASFGSERLLRVNGETPSAWAPLSGFWETGDGWVRTHGNYPHHAGRLARLAGVDPDAGKERFATALAAWSALELEERAAEVGAIVGAVRSADAWLRHPQGIAVQDAPLIHWARREGAAPRSWGEGPAPLAGVRVLDLTRVIAGPIAARDLALAGADVLRVDSPALPETGWIHLDTGQSKRSTLLDLRDPGDRDTFEQLLARADVLLTGYRPGALDRFGLDAETLAGRHPGLVTASVSAWGWAGPWAERRGFDSIVQAVSGIALAESADTSVPGALPVQALDHSTGHFLAAAIVLALVEQRRSGGSIDVRMSLARTARALLDSQDADPAAVRDPSLPTMERRLSASRSLTYAPPVLAFAGAPDDYREVGREWGTDQAAWAP